MFTIITYDLNEHKNASEVKGKMRTEYGYRSILDIEDEFVFLPNTTLHKQNIKSQEAISNLRKIISDLNKKHKLKGERRLFLIRVIAVECRKGTVAKGQPFRKK